MLFCRHDYGWPRRVNGADIQTCTRCGAERKSKIQFGFINQPRFIQFSGRLSDEAMRELKAAWARGEAQAREFIGSGL
jgi:hypothetical protein